MTHRPDPEPRTVALPRPLSGSARLSVAAVLSFLPAALWLLVILAPPLNHDVAAILNFSERWLTGDRLYRDLIDVNPPLIFVLTLIPAAIASWTPLDGPQALQLCMLVICGGAWRLSLLARRGREEGVVEAALLDCGIPLAMVIVGYDFAQREHLMAVVAIPYALLAARRAEGRPTGRLLAFGIACFAAFGFALKPHFLAAPALIEAVVLLHRMQQQGWRRGLRTSLRDPVPWLMAGIWTAYLAAIPLFFADYFDYVVPLVWSYYVDLGVFTFWNVLLASQLGTSALALAILLPLAFRRRSRLVVKVMAAATAGAFLSAWVQHKGWSYHVAPVLALGTLTAMLMAACWADTALTPARAAASARGFAAALVGAVSVAVAYGGEAPWREFDFRWDAAGVITSEMRHYAYGERLLVLSPDIFPVYPALNYARAQSTLRTMTLWLLQGVYRHCTAPDAPRYHETWEMSRAEFFVYRTVAEDFAAAPPSVVLVARNPGIPDCNGVFDFIEYFRRHPLFDAAFASYEPTAETVGYRIFTRKD
ncbi:hypothetical protein C8P66_12753 [Humitalea rosea]|uniref:4-amino-4-deoxy-L-arabinose transferase-like glycosyltransferase n=1 Tax=Humitalea rosea TaxID=990373 RepID=A0A2W7JWK7_9PROT|nr:hypothetical protein [Humitalea rosea]PZW39850.1 hypothetical protein C8P66_12753 [Humitalea rosea]